MSSFGFLGTESISEWLKKKSNLFYSQIQVKIYLFKTIERLLFLYNILKKIKYDFQ